MYRLRLFKELPLRPVWRELEIVSTIVTLITVLAPVRSQMERWGLERLASPLTWLVVTVLIVFTALVWGLYQLVEKYLPETVEAKISIEPVLHEGYASIEVVNHEKRPIRCYAHLTEVIYLYTPTDHIPITDSINPNRSKLSWGDGLGNEIKEIQANGDKASINIMASVSGEVLFTLYQGDKQYHGHDFMVSVEVGGYLGDHPIKPIPLRAHIRRRTPVVLGGPGSSDPGLEFV